jgi:hypothetical protein
MYATGICLPRQHLAMRTSHIASFSWAQVVHISGTVGFYMYMR